MHPPKCVCYAYIYMYMCVCIECRVVRDISSMASVTYVEKRVHLLNSTLLGPEPLKPSQVNTLLPHAYTCTVAAN